MDAEFNGFVVRTDQKVKDGGENSAPSPYEYFLSSLGTCAGIYVLSFCQERKIPTDEIFLVQRLEYGKREDGKTFLEKIVLEIMVPQAFPEKYHRALIKVADQCAVKKTIMHPPAIEVKTLVKAG